MNKLSRTIIPVVFILALPCLHFAKQESETAKTQSTVEERLKSNPVTFTDPKTSGELIRRALEAASVETKIPEGLRGIKFSVGNQNLQHRISAMACLLLAIRETDYDIIVCENFVKIALKDEIAATRYQKKIDCSHVPNVNLAIVVQKIQFVFSPDLDGEENNGSISFSPKDCEISVVANRRSQERVERLLI